MKNLQQWEITLAYISVNQTIINIGLTIGLKFSFSSVARNKAAICIDVLE